MLKLVKQHSRQSLGACYHGMPFQTGLNNFQSFSFFWWREINCFVQSTYFQLLDLEPLLGSRVTDRYIILLFFFITCKMISYIPVNTFLGGDKV